jgi:hypothetical protein
MGSGNDWGAFETYREFPSRISDAIQGSHILSSRKQVLHPCRRRSRMSHRLLRVSVVFIV